MNSSPTLSPRPRTLEVQTLAELDELLAGGASAMAGWHLQSLDLRERSEALLTLEAEGAVFLGCRFAPGTEERLRAGGALIFPHLPGVPFNPYRSGLYTPAELYAGIDAGEYEATPDARIYAWSSQPEAARRLDATLAAALHDHAIGDALQEALEEPLAGRMVGVMGGHAAARGSREYDAAARLGRLLSRSGHVVATGGGPGAMEAANLGAYLSVAAEGELARVLRTLAAVPGFRPSVTDWARAAFAVVRDYPQGAPSLGIPTWFYGHEPPNLFAMHIAKYFANAIREAILLERCTGGIVFLPGAAGTLQEIFQDACENYYSTPEVVAPMILVGRRHWEVDLPAWPLLRSLAAGKSMAERLHIVDSPEEAVELLAGGNA
jgi:predicted Rossmann-fold nucleotide-binding protein